MTLDRTTDAIAHFIGVFELEVEQARLRDAYEEFTALRAEVELGISDPLDVKISTDFDLDPGKDGPLRAPAVDQADTTIETAVPGSQRTSESLTHGISENPDGEIPPAAGGRSFEVSSASINTDAGVPGSVVSLTVQTAILHDNDVLGTGEFRDISGNLAELTALAEAAEALHAPGASEEFEIPTLESVEALAAAMKDFAPDPVEGVTYFTVHGSLAGETIVNGETVEDIPIWKDILPAFHADEDDRETDEDLEDISDATSLQDWATPEAYKPNPETPEGHTIVTGGNLAANEASVVVAWVDAPTIVVGGKWIDLAIISQVAAFSDRDTGPVQSLPGDTKLFQTIEIKQESGEIYWRDDVLPGEGAAPKNIAFDMIKGDLLVLNEIFQSIEILDDDHFGMTISGANAAYILGNNTVVNATKLVEVGFAYDMILISGHYISTSTIYQKMVFKDDDWYGTGLVDPQDAAWQKNISSDGEAQKGSASSRDGVAGLSESADPDAIGTDVTTEDIGDDDGSAWDPATDNLMVNQASMTTIGIDTHAEITQQLAEILASLDDDHDALAARLMNDPALAGIENARVLVIDGDLIQSTRIEQNIKVSDRDDIRIDGAVPPDLELIAGSNALLNAASITEHGVDSVVMAHNDVYSDLLMHQASFFDSNESQSSDTELANEAVAFLMEETDATASENLEAGVTATTNQIGTDAYDVMHGVVA